MKEKVKIEQGMPLPERFAEKMEELQSEYEGIHGIMSILIGEMSRNRAKMRRVWNEIEEDFDLQGKRWRASCSPKTHMKWAFEEGDSHGLFTDED